MCVFSVDGFSVRQQESERLYDKNFILAIVGQTLFTLANTLMVHYNRWIEFIGGNVEQVGSIMSIGSVIGLFLRPWIGSLINRFGPRVMWMVGYVVFGAGSLGGLVFDKLDLSIYILRSLLVLGAAIVFSSSLTYVTLTTSVKRRTEAIGILGVGGFLGFLFGPFLGDLILDREVRTEQQFAVLFVVTSAALIVPMCLAFCLRKPPSVSGNHRVYKHGFFANVLEFWPGTILLCGCAFGVCMTVPLAFLASYVDELKLQIPGMSTLGIYFACYAGWGLIVRIGLRHLPDRIGRRKVLLAGLLVMSAGMFCYLPVTASQPWLLVIPGLLCGTGHALVYYTMAALTLETFPQEVRGTGSSLSMMMFDMGFVVGSFILGMLAERYGFDSLFIATGCFVLVVAIIYAGSSVPVWRRRQIQVATNRGNR